jgi:hypothetical protein
MSDTKPEALDMKQRAEDPPLKITREIPLPWLIGLGVGLIVQAVTVWVGQQAQGQAIKDMTVELRELRAAAAAGGLKTVEHDLKLADHERRLQVLEQRSKP